MGKHTPLGQHTDRSLVGLGQYGEYCGPHTASSVFLILLLMRPALGGRDPGSTVRDSLTPVKVTVTLFCVTQVRREVTMETCSHGNTTPRRYAYIYKV